MGNVFFCDSLWIAFGHFYCSTFASEDESDGKAEELERSSFLSLLCCLVIEFLLLFL